MLRKCVFGFVVVAFSVGVLSGAELTGIITKVNGTKITFKEAKKGEDKKFIKGEYLDAKEYTVVENVKVMKGAKKGEEPTKLTGGLTNDMFKTIGEKGVRARITTNDSNQVTEIVVLGGKGKKKKDNSQ
jgi:hypothetical protein